MLEAAALLGREATPVREAERQPWEALQDAAEHQARAFEIGLAEEAMAARRATRLDQASTLPQPRVAGLYPTWRAIAMVVSNGLPSTLVR